MQSNQSNCNSIVLLRSDFASIFITPPSLIDSELHRRSCAAGCRHRFYKCIFVWINSSHCCMADILLNARQAKYLFSTIFVRTNSDCDVINALCRKALITWKSYSQTCLSELRSTRILAIRNKLLGTDFSQRMSPLYSGNLAVRHRLGN